MTDRLRQESVTRSPLGDMESVQDLMRASSAGRVQQEFYREQEWKSRLSALQQCICELLIKNQQLRELLSLATNYRCQECTHEYERNIAGIQS